MRLGRLFPVLTVVAATVLALIAGGPQSETPGGGSASAVVTRVVDGDTVRAEIDGRSERVRYIGIDTPESVMPNTPVECFAKRATAENRRLVEDRAVTLRFDVERRDRYGRLLAYVYRADDELFVNAELVRRGYASTLTIPPNVEHADEFRRLAAAARRDGRGLWGEC